MKSSVLSACLMATLIAAPTRAQEVDTSAAVPAASSTRWSGLPVEDVRARFISAGLSVEPPEAAGDRTYLIVQDGPMRWVATLFSCTEGACPDIQFTAAFEGSQASEPVISRWNAERRFVKAFYAAPETEGGAGRAVAQYDLLLVPGVGVEQLDDPLQVWRSLAIDLGRTVNPQPAP